MGNIWEFLYQTLNVSLAAALLLLVKWLLHDKLPPRWQYGVWVILALRVLLPAATSRGLVPSLALWLETAKSAAEMHLASAYSGAFEVIALESAFPWIDAAPVSVTDWLFVLYAAGVLATVLRYAAQYWRLRRLLRRGEPVCAATEAAIAAVRWQSRGSRAPSSAGCSAPCSPCRRARRRTGRYCCMSCCT